MKRILMAMLPVVAAMALSSCGGNDSEEALRFAPDQIPSAQVGVAYSAVITVLNQFTPVGDISVSKGQLPPGLELQYTQIEDTAQLTGMPVEAGIYTFTISAWCMGTNKRGQVGEKRYSIEVRE